MAIASVASPAITSVVYVGFRPSSAAIANVSAPIPPRNATCCQCAAGCAATAVRCPIIGALLVLLNAYRGASLAQSPPLVDVGVPHAPHRAPRAGASRSRLAGGRVCYSLALHDRRFCPLRRTLRAWALPPAAHQEQLAQRDDDQR